MNARQDRLKQLLATLATGAPLSIKEAEEAFGILMSGDATAAQIGALLMALRVRGETVPEIAGAVRAMRARALPVTAPDGAIDIVGTGGDGAGTYNISTAAAIVTAACGVPVAKHGNRALSSKCGSADVLAALGVNLDAELPVVEACLREAGIGFLLAPRHHAAMRHVAAPRAELGLRTVFNLLGPLSNPAGVTRQFTGVFARHWVEPIARVLGSLGCERAWVVHGTDGLDELTTTGPSLVAEWDHGTLRIFEVTPRDAGLTFAAPADLRGGDARVNAAAIVALLDGTPGAFRDAVVFNASAALVVAGSAADLRAGAVRAQEAIDTGQARATLARLVEISNQTLPTAIAARSA